VPKQSIAIKIEDGVLFVQFDGGHWIMLMTSVQEVVSIEDRGGNPRCGSVTYLSAWGVKKTEDFALRSPKRLG
jgi:hypothetical protein